MPDFLERARLPKVSKLTVFYDIDLTGFGLKVFPSGAMSWIVEYRPGAGGRGVSKRRMVLGTPKNVTPDEARKSAEEILSRVRLGGDPAREKTASRQAATVSEILDAYLQQARSLRKKSTASFASVGAGSGMGLPIIGKLLGHSNSKTTERYAHLAADPLRRATDEISGKIAKAMGEIV